MARPRTLATCLAKVAAMAFATQPAVASSSAPGEPLVAAHLGLATNWRPDPGRHRGRLVWSPAILPHREPQGASQPLATPQSAVPHVATSTTSSAPTTPQRMIPGETYTVPFTLTNTTANTLAADTCDLSYHWTLPDGTDRTSILNRLDTPLPGDLARGDSVDVDALVKAPSLDLLHTGREAFVLKWDLRDGKTGRFLSQTANVPTLDHDVAVENPISDQLGLENIYSYSGIAAGAGTSAVMNGRQRQPRVRLCTAVRSRAWSGQFRAADLQLPGHVGLTINGLECTIYMGDLDEIVRARRNDVANRRHTSRGTLRLLA
jgi:hypothetical protein